MGQPRWEHGASEDADTLGQPLHLVVLRREGPTEVPIGGQPRPGQRVLCHKLLPARVVTLVSDVPLAHLPLQLSEVQPRLVLLGPGEQGLACTEHGPERLSSAHTLSALPVTSPGSMKVKPHPSQPAQPIEIQLRLLLTAQPIGGSAMLRIHGKCTCSLHHPHSQ